MEQGISSAPLSLYIHIPFCLSRCGYCSFFSLPYSQNGLDEYLTFLHRELELYQSYLYQPLASIYFGGGSPSLLSPQQINSILKSLTLAETTEISLEVNPIQINKQFISKLKQTPINRLSIGLQSMDDAELTWLDRRHKSGDMQSRMSLCREAGYDNISLDFMYGLPDSNISTVKRNLEAYLELDPEHMSAYLLCLDEGCARYNEARSLPGEDCVEAEYRMVCEMLTGNGFEQYEISNFAKRGKESRHNLAYWHSDSYLALGASAAGWMPPLRYNNHSNLKDYYQSVADGLCFPHADKCDIQRQEEDFLMMGLRLLKGIDLDVYKRRFGRELTELYSAKIEKLSAIGMLELEGRYLRLSQAALFVSNSVISELIL